MIQVKYLKSECKNVNEVIQHRKPEMEVALRQEATRQSITNQNMWHEN